MATNAQKILDDEKPKSAPVDPQKAAAGQAAAQQPKPQGLGVGARTDRQADVGTIAAGMMGKDNRLMQKAAAQGRQFANRRGLLNSSMAAQASQSAMLDQIVPMAGQTAGQRHQRNMQGGEQQFQGTQAQKDRDLKLDIVDREEQLQRDKMASSEQQAEAERQLKLALDENQVAGEDRRGAESMVNNAFNDYEDAQRSILGNPDLPATERNKLLRNAKKMLSARVDYVNQLYGTTFEWPDNPFQVAPLEESDDDSGGSGGDGDDNGDVFSDPRDWMWGGGE